MVDDDYYNNLLVHFFIDTIKTVFSLMSPLISLNKYSTKHFKFKILQQKFQSEQIDTHVPSLAVVPFASCHLFSNTCLWTHFEGDI